MRFFFRKRLTPNTYNLSSEKANPLRRRHRPAGDSGGAGGVAGLLQFRSNTGPRTRSQTFVFWAISSVIFVLMVTLGFILVRYRSEAVHRLGAAICEGSRIQN